MPAPPRRPGDGAGPVTEPNLAVVLSRPDTTLAAPVLDNADETRLRAVLTIDKPSTAITVTDRALLADVATAASLLLRRAAQHADYTEQLRQAKDLAAQADASRQRLASAGELARRRLITELDHLTAARFTALRSTVGTARDAITALTSSSADTDATLASDAKLATDRAATKPRTLPTPPARPPTPPTCPQRMWARPASPPSRTRCTRRVSRSTNCSPGSGSSPAASTPRSCATTGRPPRWASSSPTCRARCR